MMPLRIIALLATVLLATNVLAVGNQYINPADGKCSVRMPNGDTHWSDSGNKIKYNLRWNAGWLKAHCLMTDIIEGDDLPDSAVPYTADDFISKVPSCRFRDDSIPLTVHTEDFHITVTPAGKIKLVCFFDLLPITGACCAADTSCSVVSEAACSGGGGSYLGDDTTCKPINYCAVPSDYRLKRDISYVAELDSGIRLYSFKYLWSDVSYVGVMAQELLRDPRHFGAVALMGSNFYAVDYARLGLKMITLDQWTSSHDSIYISP